MCFISDKTEEPDPSYRISRLTSDYIFEWWYLALVIPFLIFGLWLNYYARKNKYKSSK